MNDGEILRQFRLKHEISIEKLAEFSFVDKQILKDLEEGVLPLAENQAGYIQMGYLNLEIRPNELWEKLIEQDTRRKKRGRIRANRR